MIKQKRKGHGRNACVPGLLSNQSEDNIALQSSTVQSDQVLDHKEMSAKLAGGSNSGSRIATAEELRPRIVSARLRHRFVGKSGTFGR